MPEELTVGTETREFASKVAKVALASSGPAGRGIEGAEDEPFSKSAGVVKLGSVLGKLLDPSGVIAVSGEESGCIEDAVCEVVPDSGDEVEVVF